MLAEQRAELVRLRDEVLAAGSGGGDGATTAVADRAERPAAPDGARLDPPIVDDLRLTRLRMQGLIDQMAAGVARIDALGLTLRDIEHGLVDFPALVSGRQVWLCWQRGETAVGYWHGLDDRVRRTAAAGRAGMTERSVVVGRDGRAKAYRPLPDAGPGRGPRRRAWRPTSGATSSRRTRTSSRPGWAPTTAPSVPSSRA